MPICCVSDCLIPGNVQGDFEQSGAVGRHCPWQGVEQDIFRSILKHSVIL